MGKELFTNIPSKVGDLINDVKNLICSALLFGETIRSVTFWTPC